jgi:hypothetical protein
MSARTSFLVALPLVLAACGSGSPAGTPGRDASADGATRIDGGAGAEDGATGDVGAAGDDGAGDTGGSVLESGACTLDVSGQYVVSCLEQAFLEQCIEDHTTLASCLSEAQNCATNGFVPGGGCSTAGLTGCCFTPSTGAEVCLYDGHTQADEQTCTSNSGTWRATP